MVLDIFTGLVGFLALLYAGIAKYLQNKFIDRREMATVQEESRKLSDDFEKAKKANDKKKMDAIMQKQLEFLPRMNTVMMKQFKPMIFIIIIFAIFMWAVGQLDPFTKDDINLNMTDDGQGCDKVAGDGVFTACYLIESNNTNYGRWTATAKAYENGVEITKNETYFMYNPLGNEDTFAEHGSGEGMTIATDKQVYYPTETVTITAVPANMTKGTVIIIPLAPPRQIKIDKMQLSLSNGTYFSFELPLSIPIINVKTIYQPYWFFIFISLIANLAISGILKYTEKKPKSQEKK